MAGLLKKFRAELATSITKETCTRTGVDRQNGAAAATPTTTAIPKVSAAPTATKSPKAPGHKFKVALDGEPNTLNPQLAGSALKISVLRQLSGGLIRLDKDLMLTPRVAADVPTVGNGRINSDGLSYPQA